MPSSRSADRRSGHEYSAVSESRRFLCHALYSTELAIYREISADMVGRGIGYKGIRGCTDPGVLSARWRVWFASIVAGWALAGGDEPCGRGLQVTAGTGVS